MRYRLRTLLILLAVLPPLMWFGRTKYGEWRAEREPRVVLLIDGEGSMGISDLSAPNRRIIVQQLLVDSPPVAVPEEPRE